MGAALVTQAEVIDALAQLVYRARREMPVTRRFTKDPPTPYDLLHIRINTRLDQWEQGRE